MKPVYSIILCILLFVSLNGIAQNKVPTQNIRGVVVDAVDYLVKPIDPVRFRKAVNKAIVYHTLLMEEEKKSVEDNYILVKSDRKYFKVNLEDILFVEGLKDYVIIQMENQRLISRMSLKAASELLPSNTFFRINKSYIINKKYVDSFDNNDVFIRNHEIGIGNSYREEFFKEMVRNKGL